ncbi:CdaR family transcriptional regulator [Anaeroselena agilis]|uniref:Sugar diacid recognition domain-containing protein n=1 Tax=Anaeroselena agilis TaxID=3063788 RepID=A0ABU3P3E8_9FIRM|nr:sugar diacid recognition domain-containing protein [Selenomonadales bacterium 4137-cl]
MILTGELAQQIVDNIMPIVHQNVNIMNDAGIIIGSGQKHRLGTFHKGARDVIDTGAVVEIYPEDLARYPGSLPGLNWPIALGAQIIGVVGVTGHPDAVRNTAELVKMVTELILEREMLMGEFRSQSHLHEQFATLLLSEHAAASYAQLEARAKLLKFDLALPRLVAVANVRPLLESAYHQYGAHDLVSARTQESLLQLLGASDLVAPEDMVAFLENRMIILKHFARATASQAIGEWGDALVRLVNAGNPAASLHLGLGSLVGSPLKLHDSYQEALYALDNPPGDGAVASIYDFALLTAYLLQSPRGLAACEAVKALREKLTARLDAKYDMRNTVRRLLDNNLNLSLTAKALFIHRNTLVFRLKKLEQLTGLSPGRDVNHAILCKILCS